MQPIHELLSRIKWDEKFSQAQFRNGYFDRVENKIIIVPFEQIAMHTDNHFSIEITDNLTQVHSVPLHRIKEVYRDGELIWHRTH